MRRMLAYLAFASLMLCGCLSLEQNPYEESLCTLEVSVVWPEGFEAATGVTVKAEEINLGHSYSAVSGSEGKAVLQLSSGVYRLSVSERRDADVFNGTAD